MQQSLFPTVTHASGQRHDMDAYQTGAQLTHALLRRVPIRGTVLEPTAGYGSIVSVLNAQGGVERVVTNDLDPVYPVDTHQDAMSADAPFWRAQHNDWVVTNPPYNIAHHVLRHAWNSCTSGVAMLLRLTFDEPTQDRAALLTMLAPYLRYRLIFNPRPKFRTDTDGTDSVTSCWFVWAKPFGEDIWKRPGCQPVYVTDWKSEPKVPTHIEYGRALSADWS